MEVALVPPALKTGRFLKIAAADSGSGSSQLVSFEGISTIGDAQELVGKTVLAKLDDLPEEVGFLDREALIGSSVFDAKLGYLGSISAIMAGPDQDVYAIEYDGEELLVPVRREFIVDARDGEIHLDLPEGAIMMGGDL